MNIFVSEVLSRKRLSFETLLLDGATVTATASVRDLFRAIGSTAAFCIPDALAARFVTSWDINELFLTFAFGTELPL